MPLQAYSTHTSSGDNMSLTILSNQAAANATDITQILQTLGTMDGDTLIDIQDSISTLTDGSVTGIFDAVSIFMRDTPTTVERDVAHGIAGLIANTTYLVYRDEATGNILLSDNDTSAAGESGGVEVIMHVGTDVTLGDLHYGQRVVIPAHGFTIGQTYFVGEDGIPSDAIPDAATPDAFLQPAFVVWDVDTLIRITQLPEATA